MFNWFIQKSPTMVSESDALPDNPTAIRVSPSHCVTNNATVGPFPENLEVAIFAMGCFWGAERRFWQQEGVWSTQVGYAGGFTKNPTYKQVCAGRTGHTEVVQVVFDPEAITYAQLLKVFWEAHDPPKATGKATMSEPSTVPRFTPPLMLSCNKQPSLPSSSKKD